MRLPPRAEAGYVALLAVLIVGAVSMAATLAVLQIGTDSQRVAVVQQQSIQARTYVAACAEEALQQIHDATGFTGTATLNFSPDSCTYTVTNTGATTRTIAVSAAVNTVVRRAVVYVTIGASNISVSSWQEVAN